MIRNLVAAGKVVVFLAASLVIIVYQSVLLLFSKGPASLVYPQIFHRQMKALLGLKTIVEGDIATGPNVIYLSNHVSYLDIQVLGSALRGCFVAKKDIEGWPLFGYLGKMGRTLYISRDPADAPQETKAILHRLEEGSPLIIFPEGTSSDGSKILPFKSSFFQIFLNKDFVLQPVTLSILSVDGHPAVTQAVRDAYAWHGDMTLFPHLWAFFKSKGAVVKLTFHPPMHTRNYENRKTLCLECYSKISEGLDLPRITA